MKFNGTTPFALLTVSGGGGIDVAGASVGQVVMVVAVDENGVPTAWGTVPVVKSAYEKDGALWIEDTDGNGYAVFMPTDSTLTDANLPANAKAVGDALAEKLDSTELPEAVNEALAQAKASGEFDGENGAAGKDGNGIKSAVLNADYTLTLTFDDGTSYTTPSIRGATGVAGKDGSNGTNGEDGVSPTVSVSKSGKVTTITIEDASGTKTATINDGEDGSTGAAGKDGEDGYTPVRGTDYWTEADKAEVVAMVIEALGGNPIFGIVDENNNIIVNGTLPDGTYSVKYEMENGSTISIGDLVLDSNVYYSVTTTLTNCTSSNSAAKAVEGGSYSATITADSGYELSSVKVTMGSTDISSTAVSGGSISIANVTGNIVITAVAEKAQPSYTNLAKTLTVGKRFSGSANGLIDAADMCACEDFIPFEVGNVVRVKGFGDLTANPTMFYMADKSTLNTYGNVSLATMQEKHCDYVYDSATDIVTLTAKNANNHYIRVSGRLTGTTADVIITLNEPIV